MGEKRGRETRIGRAAVEVGEEEKLEEWSSNITAEDLFVTEGCVECGFIKQLISMEIELYYEKRRQSEVVSIIASQK